jgi:hypothetical protein
MFIRLPLVLVMLAVASCARPTPQHSTAMSTHPTTQPVPPPLPILSPTALCADAGDGRVYLRWNLQIEDPRVIGWKVLQLEPQKRELTPEPLTEPQMVVRDLGNGTSYTFAVVGVLADGSITPLSNRASATPRETGVVKVAKLKQGEKLAIGSHEVEIGSMAVRVTFPDGQQLIYDGLRPIDWQTREGEHLIYPLRFGNGLDIGQFDERGLPRVIPATNPVAAPGDAAPRPHSPAEPAARHLQSNAAHPFITDPMTLPLSKYNHDARTVWKEPVIDGDRITFHYWQPIAAMGYRAWQYVLVWETWWPIERERHGTTYHGLARLIEVEMPSALKDGYQVMLNNGFGPDGGSRRGVVCYSTGFREPGREIVDFSGDKNQYVVFQYPKPPRQGYGYHPNQDSLQASPLIFYDWTEADLPGRRKGAMTIAARSLYYHCSNNSCSYIEQGADGVWPNLAWDLGESGKRIAVDTVEYLYTADVDQPLPQRFINARFETYGNVSKRMGVQDALGAVAMDAPHSLVKAMGGPVAFAHKQVEKHKTTGIDVLAIYHDIWHAVPIEVDDAYRFDENHDFNPQLREMNDILKAGGLRPGFWFRPEFTKTSLVSALSERMPTAETYYGYSMAKYPDLVPLLNARGIPLFRQNTHWVRKRRDGSYPFNTPYNWVPMSMATEWWDRIIWPSLSTSAKLGFERVLVDGGFGGMQGVDYTPRLNGQTDSAVPVQPYWWRFWRSMKHVGIDMYGECTVGWKGGNVSVGGPGDEHFLWLFQMGWFIGMNGSSRDPAIAHKLYQLYNTNSDSAGTDAVRRYALNFYLQHRAPDWIELRDLRQLDEVEFTAKVGQSPVAGSETRSTTQETITVRTRPWTWGDVVWHYEDGTSVVYPAYEKIDWEKQGAE